MTDNFLLRQGVRNGVKGMLPANKNEEFLEVWWRVFIHATSTFS